VFYWFTILFTFALGTVAGDLIAEGLSLWYWKSALLFATLIGMVTFAHSRFKLNSVLSFWIAYILTRPLGASLGDYLSQSSSDGGLNFRYSGNQRDIPRNNFEHCHLSDQDETRRKSCELTAYLIPFLIV
jgi:uncharacterized membrane-anchored protein